MPRRRILHVVYSLDPGGTETWLAELAALSDWSRHQLDVCVVGRVGAGRYAEKMRERGSAIWFCRLSRAWWRFERAFETALRETTYDVVHTHIDAGIVLRAARRAGVPVRIAHYRSTMPRQSTGPLYRIYDRWQSRLARRHATVLLGVSEAVMTACVGTDWRRDARAAVVAGSVDVGGIRAAADTGAAQVRAELGIGPDVPIVGNVGRLVPAKNQHLWLDAARAICDRVPACRFLIVGDGELRRSLEQRARQIGLSEAVVFTGFRPDVAAVLGACSVLLQTSSWEGMPRVVLEAMAAAVPVVASDISPHREVLPIPEMIYGGADAAADAVVRVLQDDDLRRRVIERQRDVVARYDWPAALKLLQDLYDGLPPRRPANLEATNPEPQPCRT